MINFLSSRSVSSQQISNLQALYKEQELPKSDSLLSGLLKVIKNSGAKFKNSYSFENQEGRISATFTEKGSPTRLLIQRKIDEIPREVRGQMALKSAAFALGVVSGGYVAHAFAKEMFSVVNLIINRNFSDLSGSLSHVAYSSIPYAAAGLGVAAYGLVTYHNATKGVKTLEIEPNKTFITENFAASPEKLPEILKDRIAWRWTTTTLS